MIADATATSRRQLLSDESGYVAVFIALCLPLLVGMCALAVDVATWQVTGTKAQKAADAAALGGSVYLPDDQAAAFAVAVDLAARNGYSAANGDVITTARTNRPGQLRVTITTTVNNAFGVIFGREQTLVTRTSVADYAGPVPMGSPCNVFGNEPPAAPGESNKASSVCTTNELWLNIAGPQSNKVSGDRHAANLCGNSTYGCSGGNNDEYASSGYFYLVKVRQAGRFSVEAFDPAFVRVGDHCDDSNLNGAAALGGAAPVLDPAQRYVKGDGPYCTGDVQFAGDASTAQPVTTSFIVRGPYDGANPEASPVLAGCAPKQFKGFGTEGQALPLKDLLNKNTGTSADARALQQNFRRWVDLCTFTASGPGDYIVQILSNVALGADPTNASNRNSNLAGSGHNRMALRASYTSGANNSQISVAGLQNMSVYANANNLNTAFYLARVNSGSEDHILTVNLYDIGDAAGERIAPGAPARRGHGQRVAPDHLPRLRAEQGDLDDEDAAKRLQGGSGRPGVQRDHRQGHGADPGGLSLQRQRSRGLLGSDPLLIPRRHPGHDHLDRLVGRRPGPDRRVVRAAPS